MTKKIYLETLKSVLGRSIFHYFHRVLNTPQIYVDDKKVVSYVYLK